MKIVTNNQPRPLLSRHDLAEKERQVFDWLNTEDEQCSGVFFKYKGQVHCLDEFTHTCRDGELSDWDGLFTSSAFSGVLIKYIHGLDDEIVVGRFYS